MTEFITLDLWIVNYEKTVKESSFVKTKEQFANHILPAFGAYKINKITIDITQKFANEKVKNLCCIENLSITLRVYVIMLLN
ncbi:N-terminal phage integrase SAM-like domain-containing protein [Enterococcus durans]|uniref:N-terminal phage integrase SAM-like domain-containing protein n=1 Tax=Enterococcus durans TaxID=53345 RepID=UPI001CD71E78|nr:N-terminal phage integrase SAM-like domain-containing protein [Enterococcus durans]